MSDRSNIKQLLITSFLICFFMFTSCGIYKKTDQRGEPTAGLDKARKNIEEGRGISLKNLGRGRGSGGAFEFSTSNPMWRASLEILDFLPLATVDYSGGVIITDWYSTDSKNESIKITVRFLSNEIASSNLKINVHQRKCFDVNNCKVQKLNSKIKEELTKNILRKASLLEAEKNKKIKK